MHINKTLGSIVLTILLMAIFPIIVAKVLLEEFSIAYFNLPLHAGFEIAGGVIAIAISILFYIRFFSKKILNRFKYTIVALLVMGIIGIFHGIMNPGNLFVWFQSMAVFFGGILFATVWLKERNISAYEYSVVPKVSVLLTLFFCIFSIIFSDLIPAMLNKDKTFTFVANWLNIVGGIGFFVASLRFIKGYIVTNDLDDLLFAGITMLFGVAGILFVSSTLWDAQWWLLHLLRLIAYVIILYFLYSVYAKSVTAMKHTNKELNKYINIIDEHVITSTTDLQGNIKYVSDAFCKISGYKREELIGKNHKIMRHADMPQEFFSKLWKTISNNKTWYGEMKNLTKDKNYYWVKASISPLFDDNNNKIGYTSIQHDITAQKRLEEISITDSLTNVYNRRHFDNIFPKILNSAKRKDERISFLLMDIDHFKQYNDLYGHQMGDKVLIAVAKCLKDTLHRADDYCFRLGGEEFGIIFKSDSKEQSIAFANIIKNNIKNLAIEHNGNSASDVVTASLGLVCENARSMDNIDNVYKKADDLLYKAKNNGRNRVCY